MTYIEFVANHRNHRGRGNRAPTYDAFDGNITVQINAIIAGAATAPLRAMIAMLALNEPSP
jgi:hypothetical protein